MEVYYRVNGSNKGKFSIKIRVYAVWAKHNNYLKRGHYSPVLLSPLIRSIMYFKVRTLIPYYSNLFI